MSKINILDKTYFNNICKLYDYFCEYYRNDGKNLKIPKFNYLFHNDTYIKKMLDSSYAAIITNVLGFEMAGAFQDVNKEYSFGIEQMAKLIKQNMNFENGNFNLTSDNGEFITTIRNVFAHSDFTLETGHTGRSEDVLVNIDVKNKLKTQISLKNLVKIAGYIDALADIPMSNKSNMLNIIIFTPYKISSLSDIQSILDSINFISIEGINDGTLVDYNAEIEKLKNLGFNDSGINDIVSQMKQFQINKNIRNFRYYFSSLSNEQKDFYKRLFCRYGITDISKLTDEQQKYLITDTINNISMRQIYRNNHIAIDKVMKKSNNSLDKYGEVLDVESPIYYAKMTILKSFFILSYINNKARDKNEDFDIDYEKLDISVFINTSIGKSLKERKKEKVLENAISNANKEKARLNLKNAALEKQTHKYFFDRLRDSLSHSSEMIYFDYTRFFETKRKEDIKVIFFEEDKKDTNNPIFYTEISIGRLNKVMKSIEELVTSSRNIDTDKMLLENRKITR